MNMNPQNVTNEMLYELIKEFKRDVQEFKRDVNRRFEQIDARMDRMERKVDDIYEVRDWVTVKFSRAFAGVNILLAALVAFFVSMWR